MPNLVQPYTAKADTYRASDRGEQANVMAGKRIGGFFNQAASEIDSAAAANATAAGDLARGAGAVGSGIEFAAKAAEDYLGHREVSKAAADGSKLLFNLTETWNRTVTEAAKRDPNDPTVAAKFNDEVLEPTLQKFNEAYSTTVHGRQWTESHVASMRNHFMQKTAGDMSRLAAQAVESNVRDLSNTSANTARSNPDMVDYLLGDVPKAVDAIIDSSPNLKGPDAAHARMKLTQHMQEQIVKAGALGAIEKSPDPEGEARKFAERYPQYITPEMQQFAKTAKMQQRANVLQEKQIATFERQQADRDVHAASAKLIADNVTWDETTGRPIIKPEYFQQALDIAKRYPDAPTAAAAVHSAITWGEHQQAAKQERVVDDPVVKADLMTRLFDPNNPTKLIDLQRANVENKITTRTYNAMHQLLTTLEDTPLKGPVMHDTLAAVKASLTYSMPGMPGRDPKGLENYAKFMQAFIPEYQRQSRANTLPANALDTKDPKSLISQTMAPFKRTTKQIIADRVEELSSLAEQTNLTGPNKDSTIVSITDAPPTPIIPKGMTIEQAVKTYGSGKTVRLPDGRTKVLP